MMAYTLFNIAKNPAEVILGSISKEALVEHIVTPDKWRLRFKPDAFEARHMGTDTRGYNPDKYVPTFFDMVAMNQNDRQAMSNVRYTVIPTKPTLWWSPIMRQRCFMVKDENGRVIDVREWLDECRMALRRMATELEEFPFTPLEEKRDRAVYRKTTGFRQALAAPFQPDDDWYELVGNVPSRLTKKPRGSAMTGQRLRRTSRSWKEEKGCVRSWQKETPRGRMPRKTAAELDLQALAAELVVPTFEQRLGAEF